VACHVPTGLPLCSMLCSMKKPGHLFHEDHLLDELPSLWVDTLEARKLETRPDSPDLVRIDPDRKRVNQ
jgi:hypothetical protein